MRRQTIAYSQFVLLLLVLLATASAMAKGWQAVGPGIEYIDIKMNTVSPWSHVHAFRVDLRKNKLDLVLANALSQQRASIDEFAHFSKGLIAINGGFFDRNGRPLGLRISNQMQYSPLRRISWWGIFYIKDQKPYITSVRQFDNKERIDFAVQSGPRLLIDGEIPGLRPGLAERSALGITSRRRVIILVTDNAPMTTTALAELMRIPPLNCKQALNLDGGSSSQLHAHINALTVEVEGFSAISDAIVVKPLR